MAKSWQKSPQIPDVVTRLSLVDLQVYPGDSPFLLASTPRNTASRHPVNRELIISDLNGDVNREVGGSNPI